MFHHSRRDKPRTAINCATGVLVLIASLTARAVSQTGQAPERVDWLKQNVVHVRTVDPKDEDYSDLQPLKQALQGVRVVMLGEMGHGVGMTFLAKSRLVKFLHREMGFDVLAFESGFYSVPKAWERITAGEDSVAAARSEVFRVWSGAEEVQDLLRYIGAAARTGRPLQLTGVDPQLTGAASVNLLPDDLSAFLRSIDLSDESLWNGAAFRTALVGMSSAMKYQAPPPTFVAELSTLRQQIIARYAEGTLPSERAREARFWIEMLRGVETMAKQMIRDEQKLPPALFPSRETRSVQMGEHLLWLIRERFSQRKVIVWAASTHTTVTTRHLLDGTKVHTMGEVVREALGPDVYNIAFKAYTGMTGNPNWVAGQWPVDEYRSDLAESLHHAGFQQAFVDVRRPKRGGQWLREPMLLSRPRGTPFRGVLQSEADGIFFIHTERPVTAATK